jgi:biopolymer transport protein ExbD
MTIRPRSHRKARIEIVPLIDVVFFLLATFVMVSLSMTRNQGMQVQLPQAGTAEKQRDEQDKGVTLTVMENTEVFYNKDKITMAQRPFRLQSYRSSVKDPKVIVNAAGEADFKLVVAVLDEARRAGISKVGISTEKK